ncbi:NADPH-dependent ferric siderophore reductase [Microbacterium natoriense]|uniref:NADPH-dependent ferric siderophore reductase n=1 Tax=Microbacterium natoriense TaxID=284570 RepID=A0AAW8EWA2_9MICO|nr:siderophore-interacting protein [Microbacterium natoriense]MDQ0647139.1 NADPH-dependent ferric siderophore reductase [Microbacterium natoriense]
MSFSLERRGLELRFRIVTLASRDWLAPDFVRVRLTGSDLAGFDSLGSDDHMRLFFPTGPIGSIEEVRASPSREYTPLAWEDDWLEVEFAVHGDEGVAARWAATASLGSSIGVGGPRGSAVLEGTPGSWLLAGDETAIPAIRRFAALIPTGSPARILVETVDADHQVDIDAPVDIEWVHRGSAAAGSALIARLDALTEADAGADPFVFIAAEQSIVKPGRALLERWDVDTSRAVVKGYWKRGEAEYHAPH